MPDFYTTKAAASDLDTCERIMREIHAENPAHWPYGLDKSQLTHGLYLVREASTKYPIGFVGWQEQQQGLKKVGYYSIGILPEYRKRGLGKSAVSQLLQEKCANVDEVRALIHWTNAPSMALAEKLDVPIEKVAMEKRAGLPDWLIGKTMAGLATAGLMDAATHGGGSWKNWVQSWRPSEFSPGRAVNTLLNVGLGVAGRHTALKGDPAKGIGIATLAPVKDVALQSLPVLTNTTDMLQAIANANHEASQATASQSNVLRNLALLGGGLGLGGLGLYGYNTYRKRKREEEMGPAAEGGPVIVMPPEREQRPEPGRVRVTLPTINPEDAETQIEFPFDANEIALSQSLQGSLGRDVRRRLREEAKSRVRARGQMITNTALQPFTR